MSAMEKMLASALGVNIDEMKNIITGLSDGLQNMLANQQLIIENQDKILAIIERQSNDDKKSE